MCQRCAQGAHSRRERPGGRRTVEVDLHDLPVFDALQRVEEALAAAVAEGLPEIILIHGAPDIFSGRDAEESGRGDVKLSIRRRLRRGTWDEWVQAWSRVPGNDGRTWIRLRQLAE